MENVKLNELADIYLGVTHTPEYVFEGVPFLSVKDISGGKICFDDCKYISQEEYDSLSEGAKPKVGDMLFCRVGTLGKPIIIPEGTPLFGSFVSLGYLRNKDEDRCDLNYLRYWMYSNSFWKQVNSNVKGASQVNLNTGWLSKFDIDLPDINEQKYRISVLDKCKAIIEQREAELSKLDDLIKARFVELFGKPIDNTMSWPIDKAENLCILVTDGSHFSPKASDEGYPMLSVKDMRQNGFDYSDCKLVDDETFEVLKKQGCVPQVNDVLIAKDGSYFTRAFAITEYKDQAILSSIGMYRPDLNKILPRFLASYLMTNEVVEFVNRGYVTGTALRRVIIKGLKNIPVYMPPIALQKEFVEFAKQVDKSKVVAQKALDEAQLLFDSLMQKYFG